MRLLFQTLDVNTSLRCLSLVRSNLTDEDIEDLFESLIMNRTLEKLELDDNRLGSYSFMKLAESLGMNEGLKHLSLEGNNIDKESALALMSDFVTHKSINYLNLSHCNLDAEVELALIGVVEKNSYIIMVDIEGNADMDYKSVRRLQEALEKNRKRFQSEKRFEYEERKALHGQDKFTREIKSIKNIKADMLSEITVKIHERQEWRQKLIEEELEKQKFEDFRSARRLEKEMMIRALKKKRNVKPKNSTVG